MSNFRDEEETTKNKEEIVNREMTLLKKVFLGKQSLFPSPIPNPRQTRGQPARVLENARSSAAACKFLTKKLRRKSSFILHEIFVILYTGMPYNLLIV
jgi:hypothetical protein